MGDLSQDEVKILVKILEHLHFLPDEARDIIAIIDKLKVLDLNPTLSVPDVIVTPDNINIKINKKAK